MLVDEGVGEGVLDAGRLPGPGETVLTRLAEIVAVRPGAGAAASGGRTLTYGQLAAAVVAMVDDLRAKIPVAGVGAEGPAPIGVLADQGVTSITAVLTVLALAAPVVVLDPLLPADRLRALAELAGVGTILVGADPTGVAEGLGSGSPAWSMTPLPEPDVRPLSDNEARAAGAALALLGPSSERQPASIIFTSGSTGRPKGVVLDHRAVLASAHFGRERLHVSAADRVALVLPHAFSAGQEVAWTALLNGACLHVLDPRIHGLRAVPTLIDAQQLTTLHGTPSLLRAFAGLLAPGQRLHSLRVVSACGEVVTGRDVRALRPHLSPQAVFVSWLGSSEGGMLAFLDVPAGVDVDLGPLAAGTPPPAKELSVLGADGRPAPVGEVGDVVVTSALLPPGYWRDPERTAARFVPTGDGRIRHATGDRGWIDADGVLHMSGRADDAVKIRGYMVEPADVEAALVALPGVAQAVVRGRVLPEGGPQQLVAWVVPDPLVGLRSPAALRRAARQALPDWMVPSALVLVASVPLTERGKIDVSALPDPPPRPTPPPTTTPTQARIAALWAQVLELEAVGPAESFSELGGDSLAVEEMLSRMREAEGVNLRLNDVAEHPTLAEFAALVDEASTGGRVRDLAPTTVRFRATGTDVPVFAFAGNAGHAAAFAPLAAGLGPEHPVHAFQVNGLTNRGLLDWTAAANARRHLPDVQRVAPTGPLVMLGHSLGGVFALEAAHQLREAGRDVPLVVLIDTYLPARYGGHLGDWADAPTASQLAVAAGGGSPEAPAGAVGAGAAGSGTSGSGEPRWTAMAPGTSPVRLLLRTLARQDRGVLARRLMLVGAGPLQYPPATADAVMWQHGLWLGRTARIRPWDGPVLQFASEENRDDPALWEPLLTGPREIVRVPGDHAGLLKQPYLGHVLEALRARLARL